MERNLQTNIVNGPSMRQQSRQHALEFLKRRLLNEQARVRPDDRYQPGLRRAADEAASIAWATAFPLLFLPSLLEEKSELAVEQAERQIDVQERSRAILAFME